MQWWSPRGHCLIGLEAPRGHFLKSLALDVKFLALVLDLKSSTIGCRIITLLFAIIQWNRIRELEQKTFAFTLLLTWIKFKFYYNIIIDTHRCMVTGKDLRLRKWYCVGSSWPWRRPWSRFITLSLALWALALWTTALTLGALALTLSLNVWRYPTYC